MTSSLIVLAVAAALALVVIFSILVTANKKDRERELRRSNARVLKEYKSISVHRPEYIVNYANNRRGSNGSPRVPEASTSD